MATPINIVNPPGTTPDHEGTAVSLSKSSFGGHVPALNSISEQEDNGVEDETEAEVEDGDGDGDGYERDRGDSLYQENAEREQIGGGMFKETVMRSGYLLKRGERRKAWKKRYFVLRPDRLSYYKDDKEYQILRKIAITDIHACAQVEVKRRSHTFGIVTPKRTYYVEAGDGDEAEGWVSRINAARRSMRGQMSNHASGDVTPLATKAPTPVDPTEQAQSQNPTGNLGATAATGLPASFSEQSNISSMYSASPPTPSTSYLAPSSSVDRRLSQAGNTMPRRPSEQSRVSVSSNGGAAQQSISSVMASEQTPPQDNMPTVSGSGSGATLAARSAAANVVSSSEEDEEELELELQQQQQPISQRFSLPPMQIAMPASASSQGLSPGQHMLFTPNMSPGQSLRKPVMSGYLMKQGKRKNWRKRWFTLDPQKLVYTRSHIDSKVHRSIPLDSILDVMEHTSGIVEKTGLQSVTGPLSPLRGPTDGNNAMTPGGGGGGTEIGGGGGRKKVQYSFKIITPARTFLVCAPSEEDEIKWLSALRVCIAAARKPEALQTPNPNSETLRPPGT